MNLVPTTLAALSLAAAACALGNSQDEKHAALDCADVQSCNMPSDCSGSLPPGASWGCTNDTPESACIYGEPVCVAIGGNGGADAGVDSGIDCSTASFQSCNTPADCTGAPPVGTQWACTNDTPLSACNFAEPVCVPFTASSGNPDCSTATFQACDTPADCTGNLAPGESWGCTNDTPLSACNFAEPTCVVIAGN